MLFRNRGRSRWHLLPCLSLLAGCTTFVPAQPDPHSSLTVPTKASSGVSAANVGETGALQQAAYITQATTANPSQPDPTLLAQPAQGAISSVVSPTGARLISSLPTGRLFQGRNTLSVDELVRQVLARNPSLTQMVAAWEAAQARYPQVTSLDDPTLAITLGPQTYFSDRVNPAFRVNIEQKYPWPGKLQLRGRQALAEAKVAGNKVEDVRLQLVESTQSAFYEYYLVYRAIQVNQEGIRLLKEFRKNAETRYRTGKGPQQDILQADVESGRLRERGLLLEQNRQIAVARINTLLNQPPDIPLPLPPATLEVEDHLPAAEALRELALARRPDLRELSNRIDADQAALALANKEFYPDFTPFVMYDRFMGNNFQNQPLALMVGVGMNLPVRKSRRYAAVAEAQARIYERRAELMQRINQVNFEVQQAHAQVEQGEKAVELYEKTVLPAAQANVQAAQAAYITGQIPFLTLIEAERAVIGLRDRYYELVADFYRRKAALQRAVGGPLVASPEPSELGQPRRLPEIPPDRPPVP